jgi:hypothetical protein
VQSLPGGAGRDRSFFSDQYAHDTNSCRVMNPGSQSSPLPVRPGRPVVFAETVRLALAPLVLLCSGFFTANFVISGQYSWPLTSRVFVLTLTVLVLSYEFVYKEQLAQHGSSHRAKIAILRSCLIPYVTGWVFMLALWKF